jgi:hypothetical protein
VADSLDIVKSWHRYRSNGWRGTVDERADGSFTVGGEAPVGAGGITGGWKGEHRTRQAAMAAADDDVRRAGHACSRDCRDWTELLTIASFSRGDGTKREGRR